MSDNRSSEASTPAEPRRRQGSLGSSVQVLAHRGASKAAPENTVEAFALAGALGADAVELDVRRTLDGVLVVHHNPGLADGRVIGAIDSTDLPASVPLLGAALDACAGMWVNVEIKNDPDEPDFDPTDSIADATMAALLARQEHERWLISSFRIEIVDRCRAIADAADAGVRTAWLTTLVGDGTGQIEPLEHVVASLVAAGHTAVHPWVKLLRRDVVDACHDAGLAVNPWTCDDPERMAELVDWGIDGICTNLPDVALRVLGRGAPT